MWRPSVPGGWRCPPGTARFGRFRRQLGRQPCVFSRPGGAACRQPASPFLPHRFGHAPRDRLDGPELPVADVPRAGRSDDGVDDLVGVERVDEDLHFDLGQEVDGVLGPSVRLGLASLAAEAFDLGGREASTAMAWSASFTSSSLCGLMMAVMRCTGHVLSGAGPGGTEGPIGHVTVT